MLIGHEAWQLGVVVVVAVRVLSFRICCGTGLVGQDDIASYLFVVVVVVGGGDVVAVLFPPPPSPPLLSPLLLTVCRRGRCQCLLSSVSRPGR